MAREREPDVPEPLRSQLLRTGFIKVDGSGLADADRYIGADRISEVSGATVRLTPPISGTVRPAGATVKTAVAPDAGAGVAHGEPLAAGPPVPSDQPRSEGPSRGAMFGVGGGALAAISGAAGSAWLYCRRQRERNRPINRLRRQARRAAAQPAWPAGGLGAGLALAVLLGRRLRGPVGSEDASARATDRPGDVQRAGQATTRVEIGPRAERTWLPAINTPSPSWAASGWGLPATRAGAHSVAPAATTGLGLGGLLTLGAAGYLVRRMLRGRGSTTDAERTEPASTSDRVPTSARVGSRLGRFVPADPGVRQPGHGPAESPRAREDVGNQAEPGVQRGHQELQARTRPVEAGEVEIRKDVVTEEQTLEVPKTREEVVIDRHPVARRPADRPVGEDAGETLRVPMHEEQVSVEKQPIVTEEIEVSTRQVQDTEQMSGDVRREEARIERAGDVDAGGSGGGEQSRRQG